MVDTSPIAYNILAYNYYGILWLYNHWSCLKSPSSSSTNAAAAASQAMAMDCSLGRKPSMMAASPPA